MYIPGFFALQEDSVKTSSTVSKHSVIRFIAISSFLFCLHYTRSDAGLQVTVFLHLCA